MVVIPVIALAVSVALCPPGEATEAAAGSRRAAESWLEGAQGLGFGGSFTPPRPGSGFQTGRRPHVAVRVCVHTHTHVGGAAWREGTRFPSPASRFQGCGRAARVAGNGRCWPRGGRHCFASPVSFPPQTLGLPPLPCPLSPVSHPSSTAASLPRSPPSSLCAHPVSPAFFVTSFGPPSPVLWRPRVSLAAALWGPSCVLRGAPGRAAPWLPLLAPLCPGDGAGRRLLSLGVCAGWGGAERGLRGLDPQQMSDSWSVCRSSRASRPGMRQSSFG